MKKFSAFLLLAVILLQTACTVLSGSEDYDLIMTHNSMGITATVAAGYFLDWNSIYSVDLSKPYYNQSANENLSFDGILPLISSDFILPDINAIFFNTGMIEAYELVKSGEWTIDKLAEMANEATQDLNGGGFDENDQYGFAGENDWQLTSSLIAGGGMIVAHEGDTMKLAPQNEREMNIIEKMRHFLYESGNAYVWVRTDANDPNNGGTPPVNFADGRALFYQVLLSYFGYMRSSTVDYGILPYPKYDGTEETYRSLNWAGYMAIPMTASDPELTGYAVEILSAESCRTVFPAFYDLLLGEKIAREPDAVEVLDMMFDNTYCDVGVVTHCFTALTALWKDSTTPYVSHIEQNLATHENAIDDYVQGCIDMK